MAEDVADCFTDVVRHRLVLSYDALADGVEPDVLLDRIRLAVRAPRLVPRQGDDDDASSDAAPSKPDSVAWRAESSA